MIDTRIRTITSRAVPVRGDDIDTDRIIPARFLRCVTFDGLGEQAFRDERFDEQGNEKPHPFNDVRYRGAEILVVNRNFGCGSSREHAPQALARWGIRALLGQSFADIFAGNCAAIGLPVLTAPDEPVRKLQGLLEIDPTLQVTLDLEALRCQIRQTPARAGSNHQPELILEFPLTMNESHRQKFLAGTWDTMATLLQQEKAIGAVAARLPYMKGFSYEQYHH